MTDKVKVSGYKNSSTRKYFCPSCGMSIRATRDVEIKCARCDELMKLAYRYVDADQNRDGSREVIS